MTWRAGTTVTVLRGAGTDRFDDPVDVDIVVYDRVPASIMEGPFNSRSRPVNGRTDQVRSYTLRMAPTIELRKYDRIRDERTGAVYVFDTVDDPTTPSNPAGHTSRRVAVRKVT
jgi:hypothetical protein